MKAHSTKDVWANSDLITLKGKDWLDKQRIAGKVAAGALVLLENEVKNGTTKTLLELDKLAETYIRDNGCTPSFLNYRGYPNSVCISVNKQLVHAVSSINSQHLMDGDLISFDLGATYRGCVGDSAITIIYGNPKSTQHIQLIKATKEALMQAIAAIEIGKRIGIIGQIIYKCARKYRLSVIDTYGGHGIDTAPDGTAIPHSSPFISNRSAEDVGPHFQNGMVFAIEPLFVIGSSNKTKTLSDGWTVETENISSHHEHSVFINNGVAEIITDRTGL